MPAPIKRIQVILDDYSIMKLKSVSGKQALNTNDYQRLIISLIDKVYGESNGKKVV